MAFLQAVFVIGVAVTGGEGAVVDRFLYPSSQLVIIVMGLGDTIVIACQVALLVIAEPDNAAAVIPGPFFSM